MTLWHTEWDEGIITGQFHGYEECAVTFAKEKAKEINKPVIITPVLVPVTDPSLMALHFNGDSETLIWLEDNTTKIEALH